jgi:hypothetical protein
VQGLTFFISLCLTLLKELVNFTNISSSTNKTDHHDIAKILLKVALNTINPPNHYKCLINSTIKDNCLFFSQAAEKEEEQKSKHTKSGKKLHKTFEKGANLGRETRQFKNNVQKEGNNQMNKQQKKTNNSADNIPVKPYKKTERKNEEEKDTENNSTSQDLKRKVSI